MIDGKLDEPVWNEAARLTGFSEYQPVDGRPAEDSTEVLVWYSPTAIYFGVRAFEPHAPVHTTLAVRDKIQTDDAVHILLDTYNDRRRAMDFGVNPFGVQSDGNLVEGLQSRSAGGRSRSGGGAARDTVDLSADFIYQSKGRLTDYGYEVEIRIPFKSLPFQPVDQQTWGINVLREVQHSGQEQVWTPARRANASFLAQSGHLVGLTGLSRGLVLDLVPEITSKVSGAPAVAPATGWSYDVSRPQPGGSFRWGITNNLSLSATANPDFSQIEADVERLALDPRRFISYPEKRPFFLEGIDLFQVPNQLIYTRSVVEPVAALKLTGKAAGTNIGFLSAADNQNQSASGTDNPIYNILRVRRDLGKQSNVGMIYTDREEGSSYNRVAGLDSRIVFGGIYALRLQGAGSITHTGGTTTTGPMWDAVFERLGRRFSVRYSWNGFSNDFQPGGGFLSFPNSSILNFSNRFTWYNKPGSLLESWTLTVPFSSTWTYKHLASGVSGDLKNNNSVAFQFRGGWRVGASVFPESFKYDSDLYTTYAIERHIGSKVDTIPFTGTDRLQNWDLGANIQTPQFSKFDAFASVITGYDENFLEWARAWIWIVTLTANARPSNKLRIAANFQRSQYVRPTDWTTAARHDIPYLKIEYQLSRPIFLRMVGQYDIQKQDSLRDDSRTNFPLLIRNAAGIYQRAVAQSSNHLRVDWLFSYQPIPGTVFFAGYGSGLTETTPFTFRDLRRTDDGFFVKLSYLIRI